MQRTLLSIGLVAVALSSSPWAAALNTGTVTVPIDESWRAIGPVGDLTGQGINNVGLGWEASHTGWNTQISFDDSDTEGWGHAIAVVHPNEPFIRYWVDGNETVGSSPAYFRKVFNIPGIPLDGAIDFGVDDDAKIYVNGQLVFEDSNGLATSFTDGGVTTQLRSGINLIAVKAQDQQGAQSIFGRLDVLYQVPEPSSWTMLAASIAGVFGCLRTRPRNRRE